MAAVFPGCALITQVCLVNPLQRGRKSGQNQNHGLLLRFQGICLRRAALLSASLCLLYLLCPTPLPLFVSLVPCFVHPLLSNPFGWEKHTSAAGDQEVDNALSTWKEALMRLQDLARASCRLMVPSPCRTRSERGGCWQSQGSRWQKKWCVCLQQDENNTL